MTFFFLSFFFTDSQYAIKVRISLKAAMGDDAVSIIVVSCNKHKVHSVSLSLSLSISPCIWHIYGNIVQISVSVFLERQ